MPIAAHAKHATAAAQASDWPQLPPTKSPQTILVVDDRSINRDFLVSLLKHFGYIMCEAESAEQAWEMAVRGGLDLIITDVHMNGMDGPVVHDQDGLRSFGRRKLRPVRGLGSGSRVFGMGCDGHAVQRKKWMYL